MTSRYFPQYSVLELQPLAVLYTAQNLAKSKFSSFCGMLILYFLLENN